MNKEDMSFSGPNVSPLFGAPPKFIRDSDNILMFYECDPEAVKAILPEGCELLSDPPIAQVLINKTELSTSGPYMGSYIFPQCKFEGKPYCFEYFLMVTNDVAMAAGREFWGDSKKICYSEFNWEANEVYSTVERPKGLRLLTTHFRIERRATEEEIPEVYPGLCLKMIPSAEEGEPLAVHQYVQDRVKLVPLEGVDGQKEIYAGTGSVYMDMETDVWPIYKLKPRKMLGAYYIRANIDLGYGTILKDFSK